MSEAQRKPRNKQGKPASDDPVLIALGQQFAQRRHETGRLQQEVADAAGVSRSTLHTIEHGGAGVRWEKLGAVAAALGLEMTLREAGPEPAPADPADPASDLER